jgi:uncharacterized protein YkwD
VWVGDRWILVALLAGAVCHPERSEGSSQQDSTLGVKIPRFARDDTSAWQRLARDIHAETNAVRRDPAAYAEHLERLLPRFEGQLLERPGRAHLRTEEGAAAFREAIAALRSRQPAEPLRLSKGLSAAAADHARDQGPVGGLEHRGTDGSDPARRANRYGRWVGAMAENIAYGENPAREVVIQLLVDDGVADRGHRDNLLDPKWAVEGVACGPHRRYQQMCVMDFAVKYVER